MRDMDHQDGDESMLHIGGQEGPTTMRYMELQDGNQSMLRIDDQEGQHATSETNGQDITRIKKRKKQV